MLPSFLRCNHWRLWSLGLVVILLFGSHVVAQDQKDSSLVTQFELEPVNTTNSGSIGLSWRLADDDVSLDSIVFELEEANDSLFDSSRDRYIGPDLATYLSGLENGSYYFRVRALTAARVIAGPWSEPIVVKVEHHSLKLAYSLFIIGGIVFLATLGVVIHGTRTKEIARD